MNNEPETPLDPSENDQVDHSPSSPIDSTSRPQQPIQPYVPPPPYAQDSVSPGINWRLIIWAVLGTLAILLLWIYVQAFFFNQSDRVEVAVIETPSVTSPPTSTPTAIPSQTPTPETTSQGITFISATETPTPITGGILLTLNPNSVSWLAEGEDAQLVDHLGDSFLYAGTLDQRAYYGLLQFNLSEVPRGANIASARLQLTGLQDNRLSVVGDGQWELQWLDTEYDYRWLELDFRQLENALIWDTVATFDQAELEVEGTNEIEFSPAQLALLEQRRLESNRVSFRLVGPSGEMDNAFVWDSGLGAASNRNAPELFLNVGPAPSDPPPPHYVVVTSTPTPESLGTAVAISVQMTAEAAREGTATPLPPYWVTPLIVTATPTAENAATAETMGIVATAIALTTGEPLTQRVVTATPVPPTPTYVIITSTPTPETLETAVVISEQMTAEAERVGTSTPLPENWVTPAVVTSTPTPLNTATVEYFAAVALTTGTPTPLPGNAQTATPTPVLLAAAALASPTITPTPTATPQPIPSVLEGKIIFLSDREGATNTDLVRAATRQVTPTISPQPYVYDPQTGELSRLTNRDAYDVARSQEPWSADYQFETYSQLLLWTSIVEDDGDLVATEEFAIHVYDHFYDTERAITRMGSGIVYDPVFSPTRDEIAFVATESGNDEIWRMRSDGSELVQLTRNEWEWDKHPSWSPDGQQIVFFSNRTGNSQLWIMNRDGSDQRILMDWGPYNDTNPVWVKSLEPPPPQERQLDWRFVKPEGETTE